MKNKDHSSPVPAGLECSSLVKTVGRGLHAERGRAEGSRHCETAW